MCSIIAMLMIFLLVLLFSVNIILVFVVFQPLTIEYTDCLIIVHIQRNHDNKLLSVSVFFQAFIIFYLQ